MSIPQTIADDLWRQPALAYHVQPVLSAGTLASLVELQRNIAATWSAPLNIAPAEAIHVTIYPLVPIRAHFDKEGYWGSIAAPSRDLLKELCAGHGPIELRFHRLKVTNAAIVVLARDETGLIESIRRRIAEVVPPPPGHTHVHYDFIHSTLARHRTATPMPVTAVDTVERLPVAIPAPVTELKLVRETVSPCLTVEELARISLLIGEGRARQS